MEKKKVLVFAMLIASMIFISGVQALNIPILGIGVSCEADRSCCKNLGNNINKLCWRNDKGTWSSVGSYNINNNYVDDTDGEGGYMVMFQHYHGGDWACNQPDSYRNSKGKCGVFRSYTFNPSGIGIAGGSADNLRWTPIKLMTSGEVWGAGVGQKFEIEQVMDRRSVINNMYIRPQGNGEFFLRAEGIPTGATYVTNIAGKYCGIRFSWTGVNSGAETGGDVFNFVNALSVCPTRAVETNGGWSFYFNGTTDNVYHIMSSKTLTKINSFDTGAEAKIDTWFTSYDSQVDALKTEYTTYMNQFGTPSSSVSEAVAEKYYNNLFQYWYGTYKDAIDNDPRSPFTVDGVSREFWTPNYIQYKGIWIWDDAYALLGYTSALKSDIFSGNAGKAAINDNLAIWGKIAPKYPTAKLWDISMLSKGVSSAPGMSQPAEMFIPVVFDSYKKGKITKDFMCNQMLPAFKAQYAVYKQKAGSLGLFSVGDQFGRDGTDALIGTAYSTDASAGYAMFSLGLKSIASECGESTTDYDTQYALTKASFEKMWDPTLKMYVNLDATQKRYSTPSNLKATPQGNCMAILAGIVPKDRITQIYDSMDTYFTYNNYGYTSIANTHSCFSPSGSVNSGCVGGSSWDGPVWEWVDNLLCQQAAYVARDAYSLDMNSRIAKITSWSTTLVGTGSPFAKESYNPANPSGKADWDSTPYTEAGASILMGLNNNNVYKNFDYGTNSGPVTITCTDYSTCQTYTTTGSCSVAPTEICDGKDNNCDGTTDEGCNCINGQTKQCGTTDVGECQYGNQTCTSGVWGSCTGNIEPKTGIYDGKDNDCDGVIEVQPATCTDPRDENCYSGKTLSWFFDQLIWLINLMKSRFASGV